MRFNIKNVVIVPAFIFLVSGCSWLNFQKTIPEEKVGFVPIGKIINLQRLKKGGKLLIIPFKAGEKVELNEQLDKAALRIVKGIAEALMEQDNSGFKILLANNADEADIVIKGFVREFKETSKIRKWFLRKKKISLGVEGKMIDFKTQEIICVFKDRQETTKKEEDHNSLGLVIGCGIGQFILSGK